MNINEAKEWIEKTCGAGWLPLVDHLFDRKSEVVNISSIYQKWGALHFDAAPWEDKLDLLHEEIETKSLEVCEICGDPASQIEIENWIHTRCKSHQK